jgi:deoxyribodipyrimidine photo-lyase
MQKKKKTTAIVWFRNDLRVHDQHSLSNAIANHEQVIGLYHIPKEWLLPTPWGFKKMERYRAKFLLQTLMQLKKELEKINISLLVTVGNWAETITTIQKKYAVSDIYGQKEWTQEEVEQEQKLPNILNTHWCYDQFLYHPDDIPMELSSLPEVFTVFRKKCEKQAIVREPIPAPEAMPDENVLTKVSELPTLEKLGYEEFKEDKRTAIPFVGGENAAWARVQTYFWETKQLSYYKQTRNGLLGDKYSSKLSLWLAFGSISPRAIYAEVKKYEREIVKNSSTYWLIFELIWRDYFKYISRKHGNNIFKLGGILNKDYEWNTDLRKLNKWITGNTPEPFVNANMLELAATGFMSNRGRQNVASFFAKGWKLDWRMGAAYFESMLVDYDVHSNYGNWMYNAGVGNDPRDRQFNIAWQAARYDANGSFQNTWLQKTLF